MSRRAIDILKTQNKEASKNSFWRSPKATPVVRKFADHFEVKTIDHFVKIGKLEETIFYLLSDLRYLAFFHVAQMLQQFKKDPFTEVSNWIGVGLVWAESTHLGVFIRPTRLLLELYNNYDFRYNYIPFTKMRHTISEAEVLFDVMMGNPNSEIWQIVKHFETLPPFHPLGLKVEDDAGTTIIREARFSLHRYTEVSMLNRETKFENSIKSGNKFTLEFEDFSYFPIVGKNRNGNAKLQIPDLVIPVPRGENGKANSIAIEIELSMKQTSTYETILKNYKDNNRYGTLIYLVDTPQVIRTLKQAHENIGGTGSCELKIIPYSPPAMAITDYDTNNQKNQFELLNLTFTHTKEENER